jgi:hypothetical protein
MQHQKEKQGFMMNPWGCSITEVVERLVTKADERYQDILFPETK